MLSSSDTAQRTAFFPEIICEIISHLHDDKKTLLTLGLVSKQILYETRRHLFSTVSFHVGLSTNLWDGFHEFLRLLDVAWTSFTPVIQCIILHNAHSCHPTDFGVGMDISLARANLHNVKSLRFLRIKWSCVPSCILDLVLQLPVEHLLLSWCDTPDLPKIFSRLAPSLKTLNITGMKFATNPDFLLEDISFFHRPFLFETLDSQSLLVFKNVWDPLIYHDLDFKVKTFTFQLVHDWSQWHQWDGPFISRFLQRIGSSLEDLVFPLADYISKYKPGISSLLDLICASQYTNLRSLNIGTIRLEDQARNSATIIDVVEKFLSALPSPRLLQEIGIAVKPVGPSLERDLTMIELFEWSNLVETIQRLFPSLNRLTIWILATDRPVHGRYPDQTADPYLDLLRRLANVKHLEKEGFIQLHLHYVSPRRLSRRIPKGQK